MDSGVGGTFIVRSFCLRLAADEVDSFVIPRPTMQLRPYQWY